MDKRVQALLELEPNVCLDKRQDIARIMRNEVVVLNRWTRDEMLFAISEHNTIIRENRKANVKAYRNAEKAEERKSKIDLDELDNLIVMYLQQYRQNEANGLFYKADTLAEVHVDIIRQECFEYVKGMLETEQPELHLRASIFRTQFEADLEMVQLGDPGLEHFKKLLERECHYGSIEALCNWYKLNYKYIKAILLAVAGRGLGGIIDFQYLPVLFGRQNSGKTEFCRRIQMYCNPRGSQHMPDCNLSGDKSYEIKDEFLNRLEPGFTIIDELGKHTKSSSKIEQIKSYISKDCAMFRPPYGKHQRRYNFRNVIISTTNNINCLPYGDGEGRRYLWIPFTKPAEWPKDEMYEEAVIEAVHCFAFKGERPFFTPEEQKEICDNYKYHMRPTNAIYAIDGLFDELADRISNDKYDKLYICHKDIQKALYTGTFSLLGITGLQKSYERSDVVMRSLEEIMPKTTKGKETHTFREWYNRIKEYTEGINDKDL